MSGLPGGVVTFLFSDIEGSTRLVKVLRDRYPGVLAEHRRLVRAAVAAHGGREVDTAGDGFFVVFGDAMRAVLCALDVQRALAAYEWPTDAAVRVRIGVHTGQAILAGDGGYTGVAVHRAARICAVARGGHHPQRSLLLRALDGRSIAEPDLSIHESLPGDRYLLCSDGLSGVVSDETLRDTLSAFEDPETAVRQLIDLAIHGGGPDNITSIVADVVDSATTRLPITTAPVLAGAAATLDDPQLGDGDPFGFENHHEDHVRAARTAPQPAVSDLDPMMTSAVLSVPASENGADPRMTRARRSHRAQPRRSRGSGRSHRRRWPIVTTALVVLLAVVVGGGYIFYRISQNQYYVAADKNNEVVIYRGISEHIAGFSWSSPYEQTGITLAQLPSNYQQTVRTAYSTGSLTQVRSTVMNIRVAVNNCRNAYLALQNWAAATNRYNTAVAQAHRNRKPTTGIAKPPAQPPAASATCPASPAFGIPVSTLAPSGSGAS